MPKLLNTTVQKISEGWFNCLKHNHEWQEKEQSRKPIALVIFWSFICIYFVMTIFKVLLNAHKFPIRYRWTELLINYQGGFMRRGLLGEFFFQLQPWIPTQVSASVLIFTSYCLFTFLFLNYLKKLPAIVFFFFVFSPAALLFPIYEPTCFGRKDSFVLCAFALALFSFARFTNYKAKIISFVSVYAIGTLIHECCIFFAPLTACLLVFSMAKDHTRSFRRKVLLALFSFILLLVCLLLYFTSLKPDAGDIVKSWAPYFPNLTRPEGALEYIAVDFKFLLLETKNQVMRFNDFTWPFLMDFGWAFLPTLLLLAHTRHLDFFKDLRQSDPLLFLILVGSFLTPFVLFCIQDWGRWIYFISIHTFIFLVMLINFGLVEYRAVPPLSKFHSGLYLIFFLCYVLLWRMPHLR